MKPRVAAEADLEAFGRDQQWTEELRGVLIEIATTGVIRYRWNLLVPLFCDQLRRIVDVVDHDASTEDHAMRAALCHALGGLPSPPFTVQRLAEVLLEPSKQYKNVTKLLSALEKLVMVSTMISVTEHPPPRPELEALGKVNENPPPVQFRHVASSELFRGFLEEKASHANGTAALPDLPTHVLTTEAESSM